MHIVTGSDENYVIGVLVLIASAHRHNPTARFTVITADWSPASSAKLDALGKRLNIGIDIIEFSAERLKNMPVRRAHLTRASYLRLFIPDLLSQQDRVIYMDCDMLVTGSLDAAWSCDLGQNIIAAVRCPDPPPKTASAINLPIEQWINTGFLVMNLPIWRAEGVASACINALLDPNLSVLTGDESAINHIARGRIHHLDAGINLYALDHFWQSPLSDPAAIKVIHYVAKGKPWKGRPPFGALWEAERAAMPECAGFERKPESRRQKLGRWNHSRKVIMGAWVGKAQYKDHRKAKRQIHQILVPRFLKTGRFEP